MAQEFGSLINHLTAGPSLVDPIVGEGATILGWSDRRPATVVSWNGKRVGVQEDNAVRTDKNGMSEDQDYTFTPNVDAPVRFFQRDRSGCWKQVMYNEETKRWKMVGGGGLAVGYRSKYYDFSF